MEKLHIFFSSLRQFLTFDGSTKFDQVDGEADDHEEDGRCSPTLSVVAIEAAWSPPPHIIDSLPATSIHWLGIHSTSMLVADVAGIDSDMLGMALK